MGRLDRALAKPAKGLLGSLGDAATLHQPAAGGEYNTAFGTVDAPGGPTDTSCSIVFDRSTFRLFPDSMIEEGDRAGILSRSEVGVDPVAGRDELTTGGKRYRIVGTEPYGSGEAAVAVLLRK